MRRTRSCACRSTSELRIRLIPAARGRRDERVCPRDADGFSRQASPFRFTKLWSPCTGSGWMDLSAHSVCRRRRVRQL